MTPKADDSSAALWKYFAFISYSRRDSKVARWLQKHLESYRFPIDLVDPANHPPHQKFIRPIALDKSDLEVDLKSFWENITIKIDASRFLIVLCSPASAESKYVNDEIQHFLSNPLRANAIEYVVPVILDGDPGRAETECLPCTLRNRIAILSRNLPTMKPDPGEPKSDARETGLIQTISFLLSIDRSVLADRYQRAKRKKTRRWLMASTALLLMFVSIAFWAIAAERRASAETQRTKTALSRSEFANAAHLLGDSELDRGPITGHLVGALTLWPDNEPALLGLYELTAQSHIILRRKIEFADRIVHLDPRGQFVCTSSLDNTVRIWETATGKQVGKSFQLDFELIRISRDGLHVLFGSPKHHTVRVWNTQTGEPAGESLSHGKRITRAQFSPDGRYVVTASEDESARVWDISGKPISEPMWHYGFVESAEFSADGKHLVTTSVERQNVSDLTGMVRVWDAMTGKPLGKPIETGLTEFAEFSPDGNYLLTSTGGVWNADTGKRVCSLMGYYNEIGVARFSPDGRFIVATCQDQLAHVWDAGTGKLIGSPIVHGRPAGHAQFSPDGRFIFTVSLGDTSIKSWEFVPGRTRRSEIRHDDLVYSAKFSPDGKYVVTGSWDKTARVWNALTGKPVSEPMCHDGEVMSAEFSPDGKYVVTASSDKTARLWEAFTGKPIGVPIRHDDYVRSAQFCLNGRYVVTEDTQASGSTARVWEKINDNLVSGPLQLYRSDSFPQLSPQGEHIVTIDYMDARVWETVSGKPVGNALHHEAKINSAEFSADGRYVVTASEDQTARVWDVLTGNPIAEPIRRRAKVTSAKFSPNGRYVVTTSGDNTARVCDPSTGKPVGEPMRHSKAISYAQFSPDAQYLVTTSEDDEFDIRTISDNTGASRGPGTRVRTWEAATGKQIGELFRHAEIVSVTFSPDGCYLVTASDKTASVRSFNPFKSHSLDEHLLDVVSGIYGWRYLPSGTVEWFSPKDRSSLQELASAASKENPSGRLTRWLADDPYTRTVDPFTAETVPQWVEQRIAENTLESLLEAVDHAPDHPLALARLAVQQMQPGTREKLGCGWYYASRNSQRAVDLAPQNAEVRVLHENVLKLHTKEIDEQLSASKSEDLVTSAP